MQNDILRALDNKAGVFLVLLDLSAAFDTIDHDILFKRLQSIGVTSLALKWIQSYLSNRSQAVNIYGTVCAFASLLFGIPQGSVLGPLLFTIYSAPIANIARKYGLHVHMYADDTRLYLSFDLNTPNDEAMARQRAEACICEIKSWMTLNKLKLNDDKTEFLIITSKHQQHKIHNDHIQVDSASIHASPSARNLGIIFDNTFSMDAHVKKVCQAIYFQIRNVNSIRKILSDESAATIIHALITSRLDNGNSLLYGINEQHLNKLQLCQNAAARILTNTRKYDHITPILKDLHWLPVRQRIEFKIILLTWKSLNGLAPSYIADLLNIYTPTRTLRSSDKLLLTVPRTSSSYGDRAFSVISPKLWNNLPFNIRCCDSLYSFKNTLKTHLFQCVYNV